MAQDLVSVLIPCFNAERVIGETLESVFRQTWRNLEVIVVDDGSADGSVSVVQRFAREGLQLIRQQNAGAAAARNEAFRQCQGDYIQYLDCDDIIDPFKIETQMRRIGGRPDRIASARWGRFVANPEDVLFEPESNWCDLDPVEWLVRSRVDGLGMLFPALWLIPRQVAERAGPWDETLSLGDDGEFFTRIVLASDQVLFCEEASCRYRSGNPSSLSRRVSPAAFSSALRVIELSEAHVRAREDSDRVRRGFALSWQHLAHAAYPYHPAVAKEALLQAKALHDVEVRPDGGARFRVLARVFGWRIARKMQVLSGRP